MQTYRAVAHHPTTLETQQTFFEATENATTDDLWMMAREAIEMAYGHRNIIGWCKRIR